jgi:chorismate mutase
MNNPDLQSIRDDLARLDAQLVQLIAERVRLACAAGEAKRAAGIPLRDIPREEATLALISQLAREHALDEAALRDVFARLIAIARRAQGAD